MKTPFAKYWMSAELLHALGPEDDDADLRDWVRADLDDHLDDAPALLHDIADFATTHSTNPATTPASIDPAAAPRPLAPAQFPPSSGSPA